MKPSVIVWDLETVPDLGGFAVANDLAGKFENAVRFSGYSFRPSRDGALTLRSFFELDLLKK